MIKRKSAQIAALVEERDARTAELERFKGYKNELIDIVNEKETILAEERSRTADLERQLQTANLSLDKV